MVNQELAVTAGIGSAIPAGATALGLDSYLTDVADRIFNGDRQLASRVVAGTFVIGAAAAYWQSTRTNGMTQYWLALAAGMLGSAIQAMALGGDI